MSPRALRYALAIAAVGAATAVGALLAPVGTPADAVMVYLLAILVAALGGRGPGIAAAALAVAAYDFFFVEPRYTFAVADVRALATFGVMFAVGAAIGTLVARVRRAEAATRARDVRVKAEELRSALLSAVSHDLRTPLAVITGVATELRDRAPAADTREPLDTIVGEAARLSRILTNVLAITKVESGGEPARAWVPIEEIVGTALPRVEAALGDRPIAIDVPADAIAHVDPILVELLLVNLLENAAKYTPAGSPIAIRAARFRDGRETGVELAVDDRGPGVAPALAPRVFDKFVRGDDAREGAGVGLGLAVCRGIALAHGGAIDVRARPDGGATFVARFPDDGHPPSADDPATAPARPERAA